MPMQSGPTQGQGCSDEESSNSIPMNRRPSELNAATDLVGLSGVPSNGGGSSSATAATMMMSKKVTEADMKVVDSPGSSVGSDLLALARKPKGKSSPPPPAAGAAIKNEDGHAATVVVAKKIIPEETVAAAEQQGDHYNKDKDEDNNDDDDKASDHQSSAPSSSAAAPQAQEGQRQASSSQGRQSPQGGGGGGPAVVPSARNEDASMEDAVYDHAVGGAAQANNTTRSASADGEDDSEKTAFPILLHEIVTDPLTDDSIHWLSCGTRFMISDKKKFARNVLPRFYGHAKFTSFTRRLKRWSFTRVPSGPFMGAYYNVNFRRGEPELAARVRYDHPMPLSGAAMQLNKAKLQAIGGVAGVGMEGLL
eukprot:CAMPEP_0181138362 /NCGR_PEP_ID=MMETSP1071-20121207/34205_1 /TAXON_ID=35127 /ORGANISM="Thalassiosira sp., Strain NH16" /LENGTH=364 /DNA_ID=CAMNT_0023225191 /DNA_START=260 /DNA_END=1350 /DNA_ORIENTATION=-